MIKRVLIPLDGSELAEQVIPHLVRFLSPQKTEILLMAVLPPSIPALDDFGQPSLEQIMALAGQQISNSIHTSTQKLNQLGFQTSHTLLLGTPAETILKVAEDEHVDLIAMSTHGRTGMGRALLGSVSDKVVRHARPPVFLVPASVTVNTAETPRTILVPLDGSQFAESVITVAQELASTTHTAIHLLRVLEPANPHEREVTVSNVEDLSSLQHSVEQLATSYLGQIRKRLQLTGISTTYEVTAGEAAESIVQVAATNNLDLIAMSTHGRSGLERLVYGSVASQIIHEAPCPLLLTHGRQEVQVSEQVGSALPISTTAS